MQPEQLNQIEEEIRLLEKLNFHKTEHPNIVKFYEKFEDTTNSIIYLVMENVEGGDLETWL